MPPSMSRVSCLSCLLGNGNCPVLSCPVLGVETMGLHATLSPSFSNSSWFYAVFFFFFSVVTRFSLLKHFFLNNCIGARDGAQVVGRLRPEF